MAIGLGLVSSFFINTAASLTFNLIGSWISPKKSSQTPEDIPQLGASTPLYSVWGTSFCPGVLFYAVPTRLNHASDDTSTYGQLTLANPSPNCVLVAVRSNNIITSSSSPLFAIRGEKNKVPGLDTFYTNQYNLVTYDKFGYTSQTYTPQPNPDFKLLGYEGLQYKGIGWLRMNQVSRQYFGGFNTRLTAYYSNRITSNINDTTSIYNDEPIDVQVSIRSQNKYNSTWYDIDYNYSHGFFGVRVIFCFNGQASINGSFNNTGFYSVMAVSGDSEIILYEQIPTYQDIYFKVKSPPLPGNPPLPAGHFYKPSSVLNISQYNTVGMTDKVIVGTYFQVMIEITLSSPAMSPFYDSGGNIYDSNNSLVYSNIGAAHVYGWGGHLFVNTDQFQPADNTANYIQPSLPISSPVVLSYTYLSTIITDMLVSKGVPVGEITFFNWTEVFIKGYTETTDKVDEKVINLLTCYAKLVVERFDSGVRRYVFTDYPSGSVLDKTYQPKDLIEEPEIHLNDESQQPTSFELIFRDYKSELSEKSITVGYSNPLFPNSNSQRINLVLTEEEAKKCAWNTLFLTSHTNLTARLRVSNINGVTPGSVISLLMVSTNSSLPENNNNNVNEIKLLVANIEVGADLTFILNCVNFVPLYSLLNGSSSQVYSGYMLGNSRTTDNPPLPTIVSPFLLPVETTNNSNKLLFYTLESGNYESYTGGSTTLVNSKTPTAGGYVGYVSSITYSGSLPNISDVTTLKLAAKPGNTGTLTGSQGNYIRVGASWCKVDTTVTVGNITTITIKGNLGYLASSKDIFVGDLVTNISPNSSVDGSVATLSQFASAYVKQNGNLYSLLARLPDGSNTSGINIGQVTTQFPHGYPMAGVMIAKVSSSYYSGTLKVWLSEPGGGNSGLVIDNYTSNYTSPYRGFWVKPIVGSDIFLGNLTTGYNEISVTLPPGVAYIYQADSIGGNYTSGSYVWKVGD